MLNLRSTDVFIDLCVQRDYLENAHLRCLNAGEVSRNSRRLMALARWAGTRVISCVDVFPSAHEEVIPTMRRVAALQAIKARGTLLPRHLVVDTDNCPSVALDVFGANQQIVFTKEHRDPFTNPKLDRLLTEMPAARFVAFGVPLECSVRMLVLGLLRRGRGVALVEDACGYWNHADGQMALRQLSVKGCTTMLTFDFVRAQVMLGARGRARGLGRVRGTRSVA